MRNLIKLAGLAVLIGASAPASAAVTICLGGGCAAQPGSNVLLNTGTTGTTVTGTLNNAPGTVSLTSAESLSLPAMGAARVRATDGVLTASNQLKARTMAAAWDDHAPFCERDAA